MSASQKSPEAAPPPAPPPYARLLQMITGNWISGAIGAAARLRIADHVNETPTATAQIAKAIEVHEPSLFRLMRGLASVGIFAEASPRMFGHTPLSRFLRTDHPNSMCAVAEMLSADFAYRPWEQLGEAVRTGRPAFEIMYGTDHWSYFRANPSANALFNDAMTGIAASMHHAAMDAYDFSRFESLIDIGGGHGHLVASILKAVASLRGVVFDQAHVVDGAAATFAAFGVQARAGVASGSFFEGVPPHPSGVAAGKSAYVMSHILHDWNDEQCGVILKHIRAAAKPGTTLLVFDAVIPPGNGPDFGKLMDLNMMALITGRERTETEFRELLARWGFRVTRIVPTKSSVSIVEAVAV